MSGVHLTGLEGTNPLGFFAALGVQVLFDSENQQPRLWWSDDVIPHAVVDTEFPVDRLVEQALEVIPRWSDSYALNPGLAPNGDVKFKPPDLRTYLQGATADPLSGRFAAAVVAEGSLAKNGVAKPTDLYFTAGTMRFLRESLKILNGVEARDLNEALLGPWGYDSKLPSLMWDVSDDRLYALSSDNPSTQGKSTNVGSEALAILGFSHHPVFAGSERTLTQGCSGGWKRGAYTWPLWVRPAGPGAVKALLAHSTDPRPTDPGSPSQDRTRWYRSWSVTRVLQSRIRRSSQGGYGTFSPPEVIWEA